MRRRIVASIMTVSVIVVALFAVPLSVVFQRLLNERATLELQRRVDIVARSFDLTATNTDEPSADEMPKGDVVYALYRPDSSRHLGAGPDQLEAGLKGAWSGRTVVIKRSNALLAAAPVVAGESVLGVVRAQRTAAAVKAATRRMLLELVAGALAALAVGWLLATRIASRVANATGRLRDAAQHLGTGDFTVDIPRVGIGEFDQIGDAMRVTAKQLDEVVAREQAFSADASHQLRTPLAGLRTSLEAELAYPRVDHHLVVHEALADVGRLEQTVNDLLTLARADRIHAAIDIAPTLAAAHQYWKGQFDVAGRPLVLACPDSVLAVANDRLLRQALDALLDNALRHGAGPTRVEGTLRDDAVRIIVSDQGSGMPTAPTRGLGLALVSRLVRAQGGRFAPPNPGNARFQVVLHRPALLPSEG